MRRRYWISYRDRRSLLLDDGYEIVPHYLPDEYEAAVSIVVRGVPELRTVCCGPAAPLPLAGIDQALRSLDQKLEELRTHLCNAPDPDDVRCELNPRHRNLPYPEDRYHAATTEVGLFRW